MGKPKKSKVVDGSIHQLLVAVPCLECGIPIQKGFYARFVPGRGYKHHDEDGCPAQKVGRNTYLLHRSRPCVGCGKTIPAGEQAGWWRKKGFLHKGSCPADEVAVPDVPDYEGAKKKAVVIIVMQDATCRQCGGVIKKRERAFWCRGNGLPKEVMGLLHEECPKDVKKDKAGEALHCHKCGKVITREERSRLAPLLGHEHLVCPEASSVQPPPTLFGSKPHRVEHDMTCVSCGGKIPKGTEAMWDMDKGVNHLTHIPDCKGIRPEAKRRLFLGFKRNTRGAVVGIFVTEQTHREDDFVPGGHRFEGEGGEKCFRICSGRFPAKYLDEGDGGRFFVRGTDEHLDRKVITISPVHEPDQKWLQGCLRAVDLYNEKFNGESTGYFKKEFPGKIDEAIEPVVREIHLAFDLNEKGYPKALRITGQTHRGRDFTPEGIGFFHEGFTLESRKYPELSTTYKSLMYVRGEAGGRDENSLDVAAYDPSHEWLKGCLKAVDAYNAKYGRGDTGYYGRFFTKPVCFGTYNGSCECAPCKQGNACQAESKAREGKERPAEAICFRCGKKVEIKEGTYLYDVVRGYCHDSDKCVIVPGLEPERELLLGFDPPPEAFPSRIRIQSQSHLGKQFTPTGQAFEWEGFHLYSSTSGDGPQIENKNILLVRGWYPSEKDDAFLVIPSTAWLQKCLKAVDAYNKEFGIATHYEESIFNLKKTEARVPKAEPVLAEEKERLIREFPEEGMRCGVCGLSIKKGSHVYFYPSEIAEGSRVSGIVIHWPGCLKLPNRNVIIEAVPRDFKCPDCGKMVYAGTRGMWISAGYPVGEFKGEMHHWPTCYSAQKSEAKMKGESVMARTHVPTDPQMVIFKAFKKRVRKATKEMWDEVEGKKSVPTLTPREQDILDVIAETFGREDAPKVALLVSLLTNNDVYTQALPSTDKPYPKRRPYALVAVPDGRVYVCDTQMKDDTHYWLDRNGLPGSGGKGFSNYRDARRPTEGQVEDFLQNALMTFILYLMDGE